MFSPFSKYLIPGSISQSNPYSSSLCDVQEFLANVVAVLVLGLTIASDDAVVHDEEVELHDAVELLDAADLDLLGA